MWKGLLPFWGFVRIVLADSQTINETIFGTRLNTSLIRLIVNKLNSDTTVYLYGCDEKDEELELLHDDLSMENINAKLGISRDKLSLMSHGSLIYFCEMVNKNLTITGTGLAVFVKDRDEAEDVILLGSGNRKFFVDERGDLKELHEYRGVSDLVTYSTDLAEKDDEKNRYDLHGIKLVVGFLNASSYVQYREGQFYGIQGQLFEIMKGLLNFTYTAVPCIDGIYGAKVEGGVRNKGKVSQFNGLIGMLERSEIDIALADLSLTFTRSEVADFGGKMVLQPAYCLIAKPGNEISYLAYVNPLKQNIWICVFASVVALTLYIFLIKALSGNFSLTQDDTLAKEESIPEQILEVVGYICRNMATIDPSLLPYKKYKWAWRFTFLSCLVLGYLTVQVYNAELTTYLTSKTAVLPINQMEDILDHSDMKLSLSKGSFFVTLLQFATEGNYKRLWEEKVEGKEYGILRWADGDEKLLQAIKAKYVLIGFGNSALSLIGRYPCEITKLPIEPMFPTQLGVYLRKNSTLTKVFEQELNRLQEAGIVDTIERNGERLNSMKKKVCVNTDLKLGIQGTIAMFLVLGLGGVIAVVLLLLEIILSKLFNSFRV